MNAPVLDTAGYEKIFYDMCRVRHFDTRVQELFHEGLVKGTAHSCVGQEATAVGACAALRPDDYIASHHRGHGHCIAKGADLRRMTAELFGRSTGYCGGLGGSMHIADIERNILGANGIVGAGIGLATGAALSAKLRSSGQIALAFFGDGASNEGIFHEALNIASVWKLPVIYLCENNRYGLSTSILDSTSVDRLAKRAASYSMPGETIDGNDVIAVYEAVQRAAERARRGEGPSFIEALTYRWGDHSMRANLPAYRTDEEVDDWKNRDAVQRMATRLSDHQVRAERIETLRADAKAAVENAIVESKNDPEPTVEMMEAAVTAPHPTFPPAPAMDAPSAREIAFFEAIREAIDQEMARDDRVFVMGEDVGKIGGIFACTRGLTEKYGKERLRDTPISENGFSGVGVGAAIAGMRPIVEIQIFDFVAHMMDNIVNQAAKFRYMLGGKPTVPIVFRGAQGGGIRMAAQHSQSLEAWFCHVPGLVVIAPSTPYDAKGLLTAAIRDDNPVMFLEHKMLYVQGKGMVPTEPYALPIGKADIKRQGKDLTLVATMALVTPALQAAERLWRDHEIDVEVIDPRTLRPLDTDTILESVKKTNHCVVVHEGWKQFGFGAEVSARIMEEAFDYLDAPVVRLGARDVPMPYNDKLERAVIPGAQEIEAAVRSLLGR